MRFTRRRLLQLAGWLPLFTLLPLALRRTVVRRGWVLRDDDG